MAHYWVSEVVSSDDDWKLEINGETIFLTVGSKSADSAIMITFNIEEFKRFNTQCNFAETALNKEFVRKLTQVTQGRKNNG